MKHAVSPAKPGLTCDNGATTETAPAGNRGLDTTSRSKDSVMPYPKSIHTQPVLVKDWRNYIPGQPSVITAESWQTRNALAARHYPQIMDLLAFDEDHLLDILLDVEQDEKPPREFPVGPPDSPRPLAWLPRRSWLEWHLFRGIAPAARRDAVPTHVRAAVMERDGLTCQICYTPVEPDDIHLDHIKPWSRGGLHTVANLRVTHSLCNIKRGAPDGP